MIGLQIRVHRFDSGTRLQYLASSGFFVLDIALNIPVLVTFRSVAREACDSVLSPLRLGKFRTSLQASGAGVLGDHLLGRVTRHGHDVVVIKARSAEFGGGRLAQPMQVLFFGPDLPPGGHDSLLRASIAESAPLGPPSTYGLAHAGRLVEDLLQACHEGYPQPHPGLAGETRGWPCAPGTAGGGRKSRHFSLRRGPDRTGAQGALPGPVAWSREQG